MNCKKCDSELPANAKFCAGCGENVGDVDSGNCPHCGESLKSDAMFCQNCGKDVSTNVVEKPIRATTATTMPDTKRHWLTNTGIYLFIPVFIIIIVLLFWKNENPVPTNASNVATNADMQMAHVTLERLKQKYEANPKNLVAIDSLALMYYIAGSYEIASKYYAEHLAIEPDNKSLKIYLGVTYHNLKRTDEAIALLNEVLDKESTNADALYWLGVIYASSGNKEEASKNWQAVVEKHPNTKIAQAAEQGLHELTHVEDNAPAK